MYHPTQSLRTVTIVTILLISLWSDARTITRPSQYPGYDNQRRCVKDTLREPTHPSNIGCTDWVCACNHFDVVLSLVSSAALGSSTSAQDVSAATSIINGFCYQLPGHTTVV